MNNKNDRCSFFFELKRYLFWRCVFGELFASTLYSFLACTLIFNLPPKNDGSDLYQIRFLGTSLGLGFVVATISFGFSVTHNAYIFPAVTIGQSLMRNCSLLKLFFLFFVQMAGGINFFFISNFT